MNVPGKEEITRSFGKQVLFDICQELGVQYTLSMHVWDVAQAILNDLDENGVPLDDAVSDDLFEFMVYAKYIREDGTLIEFIDDDAEPEEQSEEDEEEEEEEPDEMPECYGWGDPEGDRNCARCPIQDSCVAERDRTIEDMPCFGVLYEQDHPDCMDCTIWRLCKEEMEGA